MPTLVLFAALAAAAAPADAKPESPLPNRLAVFALPQDTVANEATGRVEGVLASALTSKGLEVVDFDALFPPAEAASLAEADQTFTEAREAYDNLDADLACQKLSATIKVLKKHPAEAKPARLAEVSIFFGAALLQKGDTNGAKEAFVQALLLDEKARPASGVFAKDVLAAFDAAQTVLADRPKGTLSLESSPGGARVVLSGVDVGLTPVAARELPVGRHHVLVHRPGYAPFGALAEVGPNRLTEVRAPLEPNPGFTAVVEAASRVWAEPAFRAGQATPGAARLGAQLRARLLVFAAVSTTGSGGFESTLEMVDLVRGDRLTGLKVELDATGQSAAAAVDQLERWLARPVLAVAVAEPVPARRLEIPPVLKQWWLWAAVGGAAAAVTTTVVIANQPPHAYNPVLGTP